jgi:hypothetical protein
MLALLVRVDSLEDGSSRTYTFTKTPVRIGRNAINDLVIAKQFVSQFHAVIQFDENLAAFYDCGSTNGSLFNGQKLAKNEPVGISGREEFLLGKVRLTFSRAHVAESAGSQNRFSDLMDGGASERTMVGEAISDGATMGVGSTMMIDSAALLANLNVGAAQNAQRPGAGASQLGPAHAQILALNHHVQAYRQAWVDLYGSLYAILQGMPPHLVPAGVALFLEQFPATAIEPEMQVLAQSQNISLPAGASSGAASQLIARLAHALVPNRQAPSTPEEIEGFLVRIYESLNSFSTAFVGLRQGHEQFEEQMVGSSRKTASPTPIDEATDPRAVLAWLLDWQAQDPQARMHNLTSQYAEIMTHQVALLSGLMEGVRKLLSDRLAPQRLAREVENKVTGFWKIWPFRAGLYWHRYVREHDDLSEDRELTTAVFGKVFAKAYSKAVGENFSDGGARRIGPSGG